MIAVHEAFQLVLSLDWEELGDVTSTHQVIKGGLLYLKGNVINSGFQFGEGCLQSKNLTVCRLHYPISVLHVPPKLAKSTYTEGAQKVFFLLITKEIRF